MNGDNDQVRDVVVPVIARKTDGSGEWRPIGTGFFLAEKGHLVTCAHVVGGILEGEELTVRQDGKGRSLPLEIVAVDDAADLALCFSALPPGTTTHPPLIEVYPSHDVFAMGYVYEPKGASKLPIAQRVMKGHVVSLADAADYPDAYELSFPSHVGMSGAPLWCHYVDEASGEQSKGIAGVLFGSRESSIEVFRHEERDARGHLERERVLRVVEFGLARRASRLVAFLKGADPGPEELDFTYFPAG